MVGKLVVKAFMIVSIAAIGAVTVSCSIGGGASSTSIQHTPTRTGACPTPQSGANASATSVPAQPTTSNCAPQTTLDDLLAKNDAGTLLSASRSRLSTAQQGEQDEIKAKVDSAIKNTSFDLNNNDLTLNTFDFGHYANPTYAPPRTSIHIEGSGKTWQFAYIAVVKLPGSNPDGTTTISGRLYWEFAIKRLNPKTHLWEYLVLTAGRDNLQPYTDEFGKTVIPTIDAMWTYRSDGRANLQDGSEGAQLTADQVSQYSTKDYYAIELLGVFASTDIAASSDKHSDIGQHLVDYLAGKTKDVPTCVLDVNSSSVQVTGLSIDSIGLNARVFNSFPVS